MAERGHAGVEFAMAVAVLMLPVALAVNSFGPWLDTRVWAESVAAEVARSAAIDLDHGAAETRLDQMIDARGIDPDFVRLGWCGVDPVRGQPADSCPLARGSVVTATVEVWTPLFRTPWGAVGGLWVRASHSELIDLYRSVD